MDDRAIALLTGAVFIIVHATDRFNIPPTNRASTTAFRYYSVAAVYVLLYLVGYYIVASYPKLLEIFHIYTPPESEETSFPIVIAMLFSVLLPKLPPVDYLDDRLRKFLQEKLASIPKAALDLATKIYKADFWVPEDAKQNIRNLLTDKGFHEEDISFELTNSVQSLWTKISTIMETLRTEASFVEFKDQNMHEYSQLEKRYMLFNDMAKTCFQLIRDATEPHSEALSQFVRYFNKEADSLFQDICMFVSKGVLAHDITARARLQKLAILGFQIREPPIVMSVNQVATLFVCLFPLMLVNFIYLYSCCIPHPSITKSQVPVVAFLIVVSYPIAVVCAIYPKQRWRLFTKIKNDWERPIAGYLLSGIGAAILTTPITILITIMIHTNQQAKYIDAIKVSDILDIIASHWHWQWTIMSFVTASTIAYLADNRTDQWMTIRWQSWIEGIVQGLMTMLALGLILWMLPDGHVDTSDLNLPLLVRLLVSFGLGFILGKLIPTWYREAVTLRDKA